MYASIVLFCLISSSSKRNADLLYSIVLSASPNDKRIWDSVARVEFLWGERRTQKYGLFF